MAIQFLTQIPVGQIRNYDPGLRADALIWYPWVGLLIGMILLAIGFLPLDNRLLLACLMVTVWVGVTGALHLDGLADCVDAWAGGHGDRERMLAIMKDAAAGPMAVVALVLLLTLKITAVHAMLGYGVGVLIWTIPLLGRTVLIVALQTLPYVRPEGLGTGIRSERTETACRVSFVLALGVPAFVLPLAIWMSWLVAAAIVFVAWRHTVMRRLGGITGDCAGALTELTEIALLLSTVVAFESGWELPS